MMTTRLAKTAYTILAMLSALAVIAPAQAQMLQGRVYKDDQITRISRPASAQLGGSFSAAPPAARIARPVAALGAGAVPGLVDTAAFASALSGRADTSRFGLGVVKSAAFAAPPPRNFDLGAERGSKEMVLAWERWHKQLSEAIYSRWSAVARSPGRATMRVTVYSDRRIAATIVDSDGGPRFEGELLGAVDGLNGNPGLTFPAKSQRKQVSFEADYIAARNVKPGYSWVKNDYERVRESW